MGWYNNDGLYVKFGTEEGVAGTVGEYEWDGPLRFLEVVIPDMTKLTATAAILSDVVQIPKNAVIREVKVFTNTPATSGGAATLNIGLTKTDRTTAISDTAILAAQAITTIDAAGETNILTAGSTGAGTKVGTTIGVDNGLITAKWATAAFTAGKVTVQIFFTVNAP